MSEVIGVQGLRKAYGRIDAVAGIDLHVDRGEVFALLGPNGAGKTTAVEILEGYRPRDAGEVTVLGRDPAHADPAWRQRIGIVPQSTGAFPMLTVAELVTHFSHFYEHPRSPEETIELVGLVEKRDSRCSSLSGGQQRRLDLALGVVGDPEVVFLDEPTTGLDPQARRQVWTLIEEMTTAGTTVLLTTHYLDEAERLAARVAVISAGRIVAEGTPRDIGGRSEAAALVQFRCRDALASVPLPEITIGRVRRSDDGLVEIDTDRPTAVVEQITQWAATVGVSELPGLTVTRPTLEDTYLRLIGAPADANA